MGMDKLNEEYGRCFNCNRLIPMKYLTQIEYYDGHGIEGSFHHKLICKTCKEKADEVFANNIRKG